MFRSEPMQKVRVIALSDAKYRVVRALQGLGLIEVRKSRLGIADDSVMGNFPEVSERLVRVESALMILKAPRAGGHRLARQKEAGDLVKRVDALPYIGAIFRLNEERRELEERSADAAIAMEHIGHIRRVGVDFGIMREEGVLSYRLMLVRDREVRALRSAVAKSGVPAEVVLGEKAPKRSVYALIIFKRAMEEVLFKAIEGLGCIEVELPHRHLKSTPAGAIKELAEVTMRDSARIIEIGRELDALSRSHYYELAGLKEMLEAEYSRASVSASFKKTGRTFMLEGWVPRRKVRMLEGTLDRATGGAYSVDMINDGELAPTYFQRSGLMRPFDYLMEFYSIPRSDEIDPTYIFMITLAVFYGIMVSDIGYGIVSLAIATLITRKTSPDGLLYNVSRVWQYFSVSILFFGLISNQVFGYSLAVLQPIHILDWTHGISSIILLTILMGIAQVSLGQFFSFLNHWGHERRLALSKLSSIFAILFGVVAIGGMLFGAFGHALTIYSLYVAVAALAVTALLGNVIEDAELTNLISHPLSYMRLLGFGLASIIIASLIDQSFAPHLSQGPILFIVYLSIFTVLHLLNIILGMFEGVVQGARLNFAEFFSKFYRGNGVKFAPYAFKRHYTEDTGD